MDAAILAALHYYGPYIMHYKTDFAVSVYISDEEPLVHLKFWNHSYSLPTEQSGAFRNIAL